MRALSKERTNGKVHAEELPAICNHEAERSVLGSMILSSKAAAEISALLDDSDFYRPAHKLVFGAIKTMQAVGRPVDLVTLKNELLQREQLYDAGGEDYLIQIAEFVPSAANARHYASIVMEKAVMRRIDTAAISLRELVRSPDEIEIHARADLARGIIESALAGSKFESCFRFYDDDDLDALPPIDWLIKNLIPRRSLGMIYGPPGCGKTMVVFDLCCALAKGNFMFAKEFGIEGPYRVCYAAGEKFHGIPARKKAATAKWGLSREERARFGVLEGVPQLFDQSRPDNLANFLRVMKERYPNGLDLVIIDTMHAATFGAMENDGRDAGIAISSIKTIQASLGCAVWVVHHSNAGGARERGHTGWKGAADTVIKVERDEQDSARIMVACEKMSDADDNFTLAARLVEVERIDSRAVEWEGRTVPVTKDVRTECLRILEATSGLGTPVEAKSVHSLFNFDATVPAVLKALNRLAAQGKEKSGVERSEAHPGKPLGKNNWYLFKYNEGWIEKKQAASAYKDSDDAEEIIPPPDDDPFGDD